MSPPTITKCRWCRAARVLWAQTAKGRPIPLDPDPVDDPRHHGALALIGSRALGRADAVARIAEQFGLDDAAASATADEYPWHISHFATCTRPNLRDNPDGD